MGNDGEVPNPLRTKVLQIETRLLLLGSVAMAGAETAAGSAAGVRAYKRGRRKERRREPAASVCPRGPRRPGEEAHPAGARRQRRRGALGFGSEAVSRTPTRACEIRALSCRVVHGAS